MKYIMQMLVAQQHVKAKCIGVFILFSPGKDYFYQVDSLGKFRWFCIKMFFTAPVNKFAYSFVSMNFNTLWWHILE